MQLNGFCDLTVGYSLAKSFGFCTSFLFL